MIANLRTDFIVRISVAELQLIGLQFNEMIILQRLEINGGLSKRFHGAAKYGRFRDGLNSVGRRMGKAKRQRIAKICRKSIIQY